MEKYRDIIKRIKDGDEESFEIIYNDHKKMMYKIIYTINLNYGDYQMDIDSLFQESSLALYNAVFTYKEEKGMSFTSYAYMVIRARVNTCIRDARKEIECSSIDNFENIDYHISMSNLCIAENPVLYHKELEFEKRLNAFVENLSSEDRQIYECRKDNLSYKEIALRLNINTKRVDNRLRVLRKRLSEFMREEE